MFARHQAQGSEDDRILPLINIVFLLLIFFMLAGRFASPEPFQIEPPTALKDGASEAHDLIVLVARDGRLALDGEEMAADPLAEQVAARLREGSLPVVRVKADAGTEAARIVALLERLRDAGATKVELLTLRGPSDGPLDSGDR